VLLSQYREGMQQGEVGVGNRQGVHPLAERCADFRVGGDVRRATGIDGRAYLGPVVSAVAAVVQPIWKVLDIGLPAESATPPAPPLMVAV